MTAEMPDYLGHRKRLRDRFLADLGKSMPDYELLELFLSGYIPRKDTKPIAKQLLKKFGSLSNVLHTSIEDLVTVDGIGESTAINIVVSLACWQRASMQKLQDEKAVVFSSWDSIIDYLRSTIGYSPIEEFHVLHFDSKLKLLKDEAMQKGTVNTVVFYPREVIRSALNNKSRQIIISHNHPSGDVTPSAADIQLTKQIKDGLSTIGVELIDHIIVSPNLSFSFKDAGLLR